MLRALDCVLDDEPVSEMDFLVRAEPVGAKVLIQLIAAYRKRPLAVIEALSALGDRKSVV